MRDLSAIPCQTIQVSQRHRIAFIVCVQYAERFTDWCSRVAYVIIALLGLASPLDLPGKAAYSGGLFVGTTVLSYLVNGYFTFIGTDVAQRLVQRWQERLDFSIDLFSPNLDVAKHIIRRIQQETISTLLLAEPEYRISSADPLCFGSAAVSGKTNEGPPYLLGFQGTQGERHIENIKILSEVGLQEYVAAMDSFKMQEGAASHADLHRLIRCYYCGPD